MNGGSEREEGEWMGAGWMNRETDGWRDRKE